MADMRATIAPPSPPCDWPDEAEFQRQAQAILLQTGHTGLFIEGGGARNFWNFCGTNVLMPPIGAHVNWILRIPNIEVIGPTGPYGQRMVRLNKVERESIKKVERERRKKNRYGAVSSADHDRQLVDAWSASPVTGPAATAGVANATTASGVASQSSPAENDHAAALSEPAQSTISVTSVAAEAPEAPDAAASPRGALPPLNDSPLIASNPGQRYSADDRNKEYMQECLQEIMKKIVLASSEGERSKWKRVKGRGILRYNDEEDFILGSVIEPMTIDAYGHLLQDFEFHDNTATSLGGGYSSKVLLGRWKPQSESAIAPSWVQTSGSFANLVAIKESVFENAALPETQNNVKDLLKGSRAFNILQREATAVGRKHFVGLVGCFAQRVQATSPRGTTDDVYVYEVFELCASTLHDRIASSTSRESPIPMSEREMYYTAYSIIQSADFMHNPSGGAPVIIHRDIRPSNVFLNLSGLVLLGDFGFSIAAARLPYVNPRPHNALGVIYSMATAGARVREDDFFAASTLMPSEIVCEREANAAERGTASYSTSSSTDSWLVGQTLFYLFSGGKYPFVDFDFYRASRHPTAAEFKAAHETSIRERRRPCWEWLSPTVPPPMVALIQELLNHSQVNRPSMMHALEHPAFWTDERLFKMVQLVRSEISKYGKERVEVEDDGVSVGEGGGGAGEVGENRHPFVELFRFIDGSSQLEAAPLLMAPIEPEKIALGARSSVQIRSAADAAAKWETGLIECTNVAHSEFLERDRASMNVTESQLYSKENSSHLTSKEILPCSKVTDSYGRSAKAAIWTRIFYAHISDKADEKKTPVLFKVITSHESNLSLRFPGPLEFPLRSHHLGWLWPVFWRVLLANRRYLDFSLNHFTVRLGQFIPGHLLRRPQLYDGDEAAFVPEFNLQLEEVAAPPEHSLEEPQLPRGLTRRDVSDDEMEIQVARRHNPIVRSHSVP